MHKKIIFNNEQEMPPMAVNLGDMLVNTTAGWRNIKPVIDYDLCSKCMVCWKYCPDVTIEIKEGIPVINYDYCKGCGICSVECPKKAIRMEEENR